MCNTKELYISIHLVVDIISYMSRMVIWNEIYYMRTYIMHVAILINLLRLCCEILHRVLHLRKLRIDLEVSEKEIKVAIVDL